MLENQLYTIEKLDVDGEKLSADIILNPEHDIFKGHFPDVPVLPGVIMMQMVKELVEVADQKKYILRKAASLKFLQMINPLDTQKLSVDVTIDRQEDQSLKLKAVLSSETAVHFKMSAQLSLV